MASENQIDDLLDHIGKLERQLGELARSVGHVEPWRELGDDDEPVLQGLWVNVEGNYSRASFYKDPFGRVWLKGRIRGDVAGSVVFQLPLGYRPPEYVPLPAIANDSLARMEIQTNGNVVFVAGTASSYLNLESINFKVN